MGLELLFVERQILLAAGAGGLGIGCGAHDLINAVFAVVTGCVVDYGKGPREVELTFLRGSCLSGSDEAGVGCTTE